MARLSREFYSGNTVETAQNLLGKVLVRQWKGRFLAGRITETEAYIGRCDKACHAYHYRRTARTETLFLAPGHAYIYLIYGMYHCLNFVTEPAGEPCAVLIRGGKLLSGLEVVSRLRFGKAPAELSAYQRKNFLNGPGKLCKGFALTREQNGLDVTVPCGPLYVCAGDAPGHIFTGERIGIDYAQEAVDFPWRFYTEDLHVFF